MPTAVIINGKEQVLPGVYSTIKSGVKNSVQTTSYGNVCIIDNGLGAGYVGGSGILGTQTSGIDSVYEFTSIDDFRAFARGGFYWNIAETLFKPNGINDRNINGASKVYFIKASATTQATCTLNFSIGNFSIKTNDEGTVGNSIVSGGILKNGFGIKLLQSQKTPGKYYFSFIIGTYKGIDTLNNVAWDEVSQADSTPNLLFNSPDFSNILDLKNWMLNNVNFKKVFTLSSSPSDQACNSAITNTDVTTFSTLKQFTGGTEVYSNTAFDSIIPILNNVDNTFFLGPDFGSSVQSLNNLKLYYYVVNTSKYDKFLFLGGGFDANQYIDFSKSASAFYNSDKVIVCHGGFKNLARLSPNIYTYDSLTKAALCMSRIAGLRPENSGTLKKLNIKGEVHVLTDDEQVDALKSGVFYTYNDDTLGFVIGQAITSVQMNEFLINADASTFSLQLSRIKAFINKEIIIKFKKDFYGREEGVNRSNLSSEDVETWTDSFLKSKIREGVIINYRNIVITQDQDNYYINYEFIPAFEINKFIFTGTILDKF